IPEPIGEIRIVACANGRRSGKLSKRRRQTLDSTAFLVDGDKRRLVRSTLPEISTQGEDLARLTEITAEKNKSAERAFFKGQLFFARQRFAPAANQKQLTDFLAERLHRRPL